MTSGCAVHGAAGASASARNLATSSAVGGGAARATGPGDDPTRFPRQLEAHDARFDDLGLAAGCRRRDLRLALATGRMTPAGTGRRSPVRREERVGEAAVEVLGVGDDLVALLAR